MPSKMTAEAAIASMRKHEPADWHVFADVHTADGSDGATPFDHYYFFKETEDGLLNGEVYELKHAVHLKLMLYVDTTLAQVTEELGAAPQVKPRGEVSLLSASFQNTALLGRSRDYAAARSYYEYVAAAGRRWHDKQLAAGRRGREGALDYAEVLKKKYL